MDQERINPHPTDMDKSKMLTPDSHTDFLKQLAEQTLEELFRDEDFLAYAFCLRDIES